MSGRRLKRVALGAVCAAVLALGAPSSAPAAFSDPLFLFVPSPPPPPQQVQILPTGYFNGPCGLGVDSQGRFYVSDYYHHAIDVFSPGGDYTKGGSGGFVKQLPNVDPLDGPCATDFDATNRLYVNNYHRNVVRYNATPSFGTPTLFDASHPTGLAVDPGTGNVYVNNRTYIAVYDSTGAPVLDGGEPLKIGLGTLGDGYGLAFSQFPGTFGRLYVPDASTDTVKIYEPSVNKVNPVATIDGAFTPTKGFVSLRDSAIAINKATGEVFVVDNTQSKYTEKPQGIVYVFDSTGLYKGHLKYNVYNALSPGLAIDNSNTVLSTPGGPVPTQGRVYVTSGNTDKAGVYAYPPGAATFANPLPPTTSLVVSASGAGSGSITSAAAGIDCSSVCAEEMLAAEQLSLTANPDPSSSFAGWSGEACSGSGATCTLTMDEAISINAHFAEAPTAQGAADPQSTSPAAATTTNRRARRNHRKQCRKKQKRCHRSSRRHHRSVQRP